MNVPMLTVHTDRLWLGVRQETLLPMEQLLGGQVHLLVVTSLHRRLPDGHNVRSMLQCLMIYLHSFHVICLQSGLVTDLQWLVFFTSQLKVLVIRVPLNIMSAPIIPGHSTHHRHHTCILLRLVIPDLLLVAAGDLRHDELDILGDQLALLPGNGLTRLGPGPDLIRKSAIYLRRWEFDTVCGAGDLCLHTFGIGDTWPCRRH